MFFSKLQKIINKRVEECGAPYTLFGIFGVINYPVFYLFWKYVFPQGYSSLFLRATATFLSLILLFHSRWPSKLRPWLPLYWYFTLLFCLPFFFTFMFFQNHGSSVWAFSLIPISVFLMLLTDWASGLILLLLGSALGTMCSYFLMGGFQFTSDVDYIGFLLNYIFSAIIGFVFVLGRQSIEKEKLQTMRSIGSSIAHELRTPLLAIRAGATGSKNLIRQASEKELTLLSEEKKMPLSNLVRVINSIESEAYSANTIINMLLTKVNHIEEVVSCNEVCSMLQIIASSINRYPFNSEEERSLIHYSKDRDFLFLGNEVLMIHVFFNLIKNAIYYINAEGKGVVDIQIQPGEKANLVYLRDTGKGIPKNELPYIFDKFFSKTPNGTGLGLWFCKMVIESCKGNIACASEKNEFTEFLLEFPILKSN